MIEIEPKVYVIAHTSIDEQGLQDALTHIGAPNWTTNADSDAAKLTEVAGKTCYMSFDKSLNKNLTKTSGRTNRQHIQNGLIKNGHGSVLEHSSITFYIADVSRVVTHELIRHRAGTAFSQTSGRYVRNGEFKAFIPSYIRAVPELYQSYRVAIQSAEHYNQQMWDTIDNDSLTFADKKKRTSEMRRLLPTGEATNIVLTANHRAIRHMIAMRTSPHAEEEIRIVFAQISKLMRERFPTIYADAQVRVVDGIEVTEFKYDKV